MRALLAALGLLVADQAIQHAALGDGRFLGLDVAPFSPPLFSDLQRGFLDEYEAWLERDPEAFLQRSLFDPDLGWCPPPGHERGLSRHDWSGSRLAAAPLPREGRAGEARIAALGCSFTFGSEVRGTETWVARVEAARPGARIGNFAVPGYGADQALLRWRRDVRPLGVDEVWLGYFPGSALRATTLFPPLCHRWRGRTILFKPRFARDGTDDLVLHPCPTRVPSDVVRLLRDQRSFFEALAGRDHWVDRAPAAYAPPGSRLSHHLAIGRIALALHERRGRDVAAALADPQGEVYRLNRAIVLQLAEEVGAAGARFRLLILPGQIELGRIGAEGSATWRAWVADLRGRGVEVLDAAERLLSRGAAQDGAYWMPGGHYSALANECVAEAVCEAWW